VNSSLDGIEYFFVNIAAIIRGWLVSLGFSGGFVEAIMGVVYLAALLIVCIVSVLFYVVWERKLAGFIQRRPGPNRLGPFGWFQAIGDTFKLLGKEDIVPREADRKLHFLAPVIVFIPTILIMSFLPFGDKMAVMDLRAGIFFVVALMALSSLPVFMAGWASHNKYSLLGAMRSISQTVSYEIPLIFSLLGVVMITGSFNLQDIVSAQENVWFVVLQPLAFLIFFISSIAETNRAPFDLPEGESELTAGIYTEYSGMKWALFFLAEYCNMFVINGLGVTLFLGGWHGPFLPGWLWFILKIHILMSLFIYARWTFPRIRVDHLQTLGWKILIPLSLFNIFITGIGVYLV